MTKTRVQILRLVLLFEGGSIAVATVLGLVLGQSPWRHIDPGWSGLLRGLLAMVPLSLILLWIERCRWEPLRRLFRVVDAAMSALFADLGVVDLAFVALLAGVGEELLFRGFIQATLAEKLPQWTAIGIASLVFGMAHSVTRLYAILAFGIGVYLGWLFVAFENLLVPIVVHAGYDFVALLFLLRRGSPKRS